MTWAWATPLPPTSKLVLMALADIADDQGVCWPSHKNLALKCTLADRTVRRMLILLQAQQLLFVEPRVRRDGSRASNCYRLAVDAHPPGQIVRGGGHVCPGGRSPVTKGVDTVVLPRTTNEPSYEPSPPPPDRDQQCDAVAINAGGGDLYFPNGLGQSQRQALRNRLATLTFEQAQQVLDELAGRMAVTPVKNPIRYCTVLAYRMKRGAFLPELGLKIADARQAERARGKQMSALAAELDATKLPKRLLEAVERMRAKANVLPMDVGGTR